VLSCSSWSCLYVVLNLGGFVHCPPFEVELRDRLSQNRAEKAPELSQPAYGVLMVVIASLMSRAIPRLDAQR